MTSPIAATTLRRQRQRLFLVQTLDRMTTTSSKSWSLFSWVLLTRVTVTLFMALSCRLGTIVTTTWLGLPPPPNDDSVVQFDIMRMMPTKEEDGGFATPGTFCDCGSQCQWEDVVVAVQAENHTSTCRSNVLQCTIYPFLLEPLTRWDSARFLRLALQPQLRQPNWNQTMMDDNHNKKDDPKKDNNNNHLLLFQESEMAHAFFPLFPLWIQFVAHILLSTIPKALLPGTCQGVLVLAAWLGNTVCVVVAARALYQMTHDLQQRYGYNASHICHAEARKVALLFVVWNPASVFFCASYSEALFSACVFTGAQWILLSASFATVWQSHLQFAWGVLCWMAASYGRSNGILYVGYLMLHGMGRALQPHLKPRQRLGRILYYMVAMVLVALPLVIHNQHGVDVHCKTMATTMDDYERPEWCQQDNMFYLYPYVQRKYWNVGVLRYFEWKQVPNFVLAAPILGISVWATLLWIASSWRRHKPLHQASLSFWQRVVVWAVRSLQEATSDNNWVQGSTKYKKDDSEEHNNREEDDPASLCYLAPSLLSHYAVLAASALLTFTTAHVQISTRVLCSSCPAVYWFLASRLKTQRGGRSNSNQQDDENGDGGVLGEAIFGYCALYIVLGIVLHPNWLPWT